MKDMKGMKREFSNACLRERGFDNKQGLTTFVL